MSNYSSDVLLEKLTDLREYIEKICKHYKFYRDEEEKVKKLPP